MKEYVQSPLNYTGGKYKLLSQIIPLFPNHIDTFVDLLCGGGTVGANVSCNQVVFNDADKHVMGLLSLFDREDPCRLKEDVLDIIKHYGLSLVAEHSYDYYGCDSSKGLSLYNKEPFLNLREQFNRLSTKDHRYYLYLYVLVVYAFNNQLRFNAKGQFNLPVGKRDFNKDMQEKLVVFMERLHQIKITLTCADFTVFNAGRLTPDDFVYVDPPYLITCASYNEKNGWNRIHERRLYDYLDQLDAHHIRFAFSNVLMSKGKKNELLSAWLDNNRGRYRCNHLNYSYSNSNYHKLDRQSVDDEVLIINY